MIQRFSDPGPTVYDFAEQFLVVCPECACCAVVRLDDSARSAKLTCTSCGYAKSGQAQRVSAINDARDLYFLRPLWLCTRCAGHELWARNADHLAFLEQYVGAALRERPVIDRAKFYWRNRHLSSRLPVWMKTRKNRDEVLRGLATLRARLAEAERVGREVHAKLGRLLDLD